MTTEILIVYLIGKVSASFGFVIVYLVTAELYPTNLRSQAVGLCSMWSRVAGLTAPYVTALAVHWTPLPMLVLGVPAIVAAFLALFLTETSGKDLPQNMMDLEVFLYLF